LIILFEQELSMEHKKRWIGVIRSNCLKAMTKLLDLSRDENDEIQVEQQNKFIAEKIARLDESFYLNMGKLWSDSFVDHLLQLWNDEFIQQIWKTKGGLIDLENIEYNFENLDERIRYEDYTPTSQDVILNAKKTVGLQDAVYKLDDSLQITIWDTGGQRNERKKVCWYCFI
jgi:hypothetical protein